ncbi:MAG: Glyoxalase/bleomycin resistance protein/dioxygenase [Segetibacter sp.]|nr:Glyoxalase/bleomycin resistance protein/dioxygenase [Segetibacter sp.]
MIKKLLSHLLFFVVFATFGFQTKAQNKKPVMLNHIAVYVKDLQGMTEFYRTIVGIDTMPEPFHDGRHTWFPIGEHSQLHLIKGAKEISQHDKNGHLCFTVSSVDDFVKRLIAAGIHYEDWPGKANSITTRVDGVKQVYFQDPENFWIEINDDKY